MKHRLEIDWNTPASHSTPVPEDTQDALIDDAIERVRDLRKEGYYREGELHSEVDGVDYAGWWRLRELCEKDDEQPVAPPTPSALERFMALWDKYSALDINASLAIRITPADKGRRAAIDSWYRDGAGFLREFSYAIGYGRTTEEACEVALHNYEQQNKNE